MKEKILAWLTANQEYLSTFDLNKDGEIDKMEGERACEAILEWAAALKDADGSWYYAEGANPIGPVSRETLLAAVQSAPETYISYGEKDLWLPYTALLLVQD